LEKQKQFLELLEANKGTDNIYVLRWAAKAHTKGLHKKTGDELKKAKEELINLIVRPIGGDAEWMGELQNISNAEWESNHPKPPAEITGDDEADKKARRALKRKRNTQKLKHFKTYKTDTVTKAIPKIMKKAREMQ